MTMTTREVTMGRACHQRVETDPDPEANEVESRACLLRSIYVPRVCTIYQLSVFHALLVIL